MNRERALWGAILVPFKIPLAIFKMFFTEQRYNETVNKYRSFAARFAASIDFQTGISEKRTTKHLGRDVRTRLYLWEDPLGSRSGDLLLLRLLRVWHFQLPIRDVRHHLLDIARCQAQSDCAHWDGPTIFEVIYVTFFCQLFLQVC